MNKVLMVRGTGALVVLYGANELRKALAHDDPRMKTAMSVSSFGLLLLGGALFIVPVTADGGGDGGSPFDPELAPEPDPGGVAVDTEELTDDDVAVIGDVDEPLVVGDVELSEEGLDALPEREHEEVLIPATVDAIFEQLRANEAVLDG